MIDRKPRLIAKCTDVADVMAAVRMAKANGLRVSIRGGGHNAAGLGVCDDGMVIDLAPINYVRVDPSSRTVLVGAGCKWSDVDHATHAFGLAVPSGIISSTGVAGLTLGGGMGHLTRKYGLTIDNLLSVDMVLADGSFVVANAEENADLFWAVRGGGGNFGIVTSFLFEAHPVDTVCAGPMLWNLEDAADVMKWYREFITQAPEEMNGFFAMMTRAAGAALPRGAALAEDVRDRVVLSGFDGAGEYDSGTDSQLPAAGIRILRADAVSDAAGNVRRRFTPPVCNGTGRPISSRNSATRRLTSISNTAALLPTWQSTMHLYPVNGKVNRVGADRHSVQLSRCRLERGDCGSGPRSGEPRQDHRLGQELLRCPASVRRRRGLSEFHDGRRRGPDSGDVPRELRSAGGDQSEVRSREFLPRESEHPAGALGLDRSPHSGSELAFSMMI